MKKERGLLNIFTQVQIHGCIPAIKVETNRKEKFQSSTVYSKQNKPITLKSDDNMTKYFEIWSSDKPI